MDLDFLGAPGVADLWCSQPGKLRIPGGLKPSSCGKGRMIPEFKQEDVKWEYICWEGNGRNGEFQGTETFSRE